MYFHKEEELILRDLQWNTFLIVTKYKIPLILEIFQFSSDFCLAFEELAEYMPT